MPFSVVYEGRDPIEILRETRNAYFRALKIRRKRGLPVIELDATLPIKENTEILIDQLEQVAGIPRAASPAPNSASAA